MPCGVLWCDEMCCIRRNGRHHGGSGRGWVMMEKLFGVSWHFPHKSRFFVYFHSVFKKKIVHFWKKSHKKRSYPAYTWSWSAVVPNAQSGRIERISSRRNPPHGIESTGYVLCLNIWVHNHKQARIQVFQLMFFVARWITGQWLEVSVDLSKESQEISYNHTLPNKHSQRNPIPCLCLLQTHPSSSRWWQSTWNRNPVMMKRPTVWMRQLLIGYSIKVRPLARIIGSG